MTTKERLLRYREIERMIVTIGDEREEIRTACVYDEGAIREADRKIAALAAEKAQIRAWIEKLPDGVEKRLIIYRYVCDLPWKLVEYKIAYGRRQTVRLHNKALAMLDHYRLPTRINQDMGTDGTS